LKKKVAKTLAFRDSATGCAAGAAGACFSGVRGQVLCLQLSLHALLGERTNTDTRGAARAGNQFTCFTGTKVQILTPEALRGQGGLLVAFVSVQEKVQQN
jgi:hypothetical protein